MQRPVIVLLNSLKPPHLNAASLETHNHENYGKYPPRIFLKSICKPPKTSMPASPHYEAKFSLREKRCCLVYHTLPELNKGYGRDWINNTSLQYYPSPLVLLPRPVSLLVSAPLLVSSSYSESLKSGRNRYTLRRLPFLPLHLLQ